MLADHWGTLKAIMWNVKGFNHLNKRMEILILIKPKKWLLHYFSKPIYYLLKLKKSVGTGWVDFFASFGNSQSRGVAIFIHRHLQFRCIKEDGD